MLVMACLDKDPKHRPSARMLTQALTEVQDGLTPQLQRLDDDPTVRTGARVNKISVENLILAPMQNM